jgi:hypothetical protein
LEHWREKNEKFQLSSWIDHENIKIYVNKIRWQKKLFFSTFKSILNFINYSSQLLECVAKNFSHTQLNKKLRAREIAADTWSALQTTTANMLPRSPLVTNLLSLSNGSTPIGVLCRSN